MIATMLAVALFNSTAQAETKHPCEEIKKACEAAGFKRGQSKEGTGLWVDCVAPLMQAKPQPAKAKLKLPTIDAKLVTECKEKHPEWGEGKKP